MEQFSRELLYLHTMTPCSYALNAQDIGWDFGIPLYFNKRQEKEAGETNMVVNDQCTCCSQDQQCPELCSYVLVFCFMVALKLSVFWAEMLL